MKEFIRLHDWLNSVAIVCKYIQSFCLLIGVGFWVSVVVGLTAAGYSFALLKQYKWEIHKVAF